MGNLHIFDSEKERQNFSKWIEKIAKKANKIIVTNIRGGDYEFVTPKPNNRKKQEKGKQQTLGGATLFKLQNIPYFRLGKIIVPMFAFKGDKEYNRGLNTVFPYSLVSILWKTNGEGETPIEIDSDSAKLERIRKVFSKEYKKRFNVHLQMLRDIQDILEGRDKRSENKNGEKKDSK